MNKVREPATAYVSGALTGLSGEEHLRLYDEAANVLRRFRFEPYLPHLATDPVAHPDVKPSVVYDIDRTRVANANLLVAFLAVPSLGVGMELEIAGQALVPVLPVFRQGDRVSRMALGGLARVYGPAIYTSIDDLREKLTALLNVVTEDMSARALPAVPQLGARIRRLREARGVSLGELAVRVGTSEHVLAVLEEAPPRVSNPSLMLLGGISEVLGARISQILGEELLGASALRESLRSYASELGLSLDEYRRLEQAAIRAIEADRPVSFADWDRMREARMMAAAGVQQLELLDR